MPRGPLALPFLTILAVLSIFSGVAAASFYTPTDDTDTSPPSPPGTLSLTAPADGELKLDWGAASDLESGINGYVIYRAAVTFSNATKLTDAEVVAAPGNVLTYTDKNVVRGDVYVYAVGAENKAGIEGDIGNVASDTVTGINQFPHAGYSSTTNLCRNCHKIHRSPSPTRVFRKGPNPEETCFACHDGTGSVYDIRQTFEAAAHGTVLTPPASTQMRCMHCHNPHSATAVIGSNPYLNREFQEELCLTCHVDGHSKNGWAITSQFSGFSFHSIKSSTTTDGLPGAAIECSNCHGPHTAEQGPAGSDFTNRLADPFNTYQKWGGAATQANFVDFCLNCHKPAPWPQRTELSASVFIPYDVQFPTMSPVTFPFFWGWDKTAFRDQAPAAAHFSQGLACRNCHSPHGSDNPRLNAYFNPPSPGANTTNNYDGSSAAAREERLCLQCHRATPPTGFSTAPNILSDVANDSSNNSSNGTWFTMPIRDATMELRHMDTEALDAFGPPSTSGLPNRHVECVDCHDPHRAQAGDPPAGNDISPANFGVAGISVTNGTQGTVPSYTVTQSPTEEYELCFKCHSFWAYGTTRPASAVYNTGLQADKSIEFNPANSSYHPIEAAGKNVSENLNDQLLGGLSTSSTLRCSDCHTSNNLSGVQGQAINFAGSAARGPHGSNQRSIRRGTYWTDVNNLPGSWSAANFSLCGGCHNLGVLTARRWGDGARTNFYDDVDGRDNLHEIHLIDRINATCKNCHYNIHSNVETTTYANNTQWNVDGVIYGDQAGEMPPPNIDTHLINFSPEITPFGGRTKPEWVYNSTTRLRNCNLTCHGGDMDNFPYRPARPGATNGGDQPPGQ